MLHGPWVPSVSERLVGVPFSDVIAELTRRYNAFHAKRMAEITDEVLGPPCKFKSVEFMRRIPVQRSV